METSEVLRAIATLFSEAYAGPPDPRSTWFIDNEPDSGILGIIKNVSAKEASWSSRHNDPGTTIAANVEHLRWSLANANRLMQGEDSQGSWRESWHLLNADEEQWSQLRNELKKEYERLHENIQKQGELTGEYLLGVMALIPHAAYHLGTIRQLIERARSNEAPLA